MACLTVDQLGGCQASFGSMLQLRNDYDADLDEYEVVLQLVAVEGYSKYEDEGVDVEERALHVVR